MRPLSDAGEDWGREALTTGRFQDYCKIVAHTDDGLAQIAVYNKYIDDWNTVSKTFTDDTPMVAKIWDCMWITVTSDFIILNQRRGSIGDLLLSKENSTLLFILRWLLFQSLGCFAGWTSKKLASTLNMGKLRI